MDAILSSKADGLDTSERIGIVNTGLASVGNGIKDLREELRGEVKRLGDKLDRKVDVDEVEGLKMGVVSGADWRGAMADVSMNLRRELSDKAGREEMIQMIRREVDGVKEGVSVVKGVVEGKSEAGDVNQVVADLESLSARFAEAHSEGRWLWRSGKVSACANERV